MEIRRRYYEVMLKAGFRQGITRPYPHWFGDPERMKTDPDGEQEFSIYEMFSPIRFNQLTLKNRIYHWGRWGNLSMAEEMGRPSNKMIQYFADPARLETRITSPSGLIPISQAVESPSTERGNNHISRIDSYVRSSGCGPGCSSGMQTARASSSSLPPV